MRLKDEEIRGFIDILEDSNDPIELLAIKDGLLDALYDELERRQNTDI